MKPNKLSNPKNYVLDSLPKCCKKARSCKADRLEQAFTIARAKLAIETNALDFIKQKRYIMAAIRTLLSKQQRLRL